jgi:hypothetical protein
VNPQNLAESIIDEAAFRELLLSGRFAPHFRKILAILRRRAKPEIANDDNFDHAITSVAVGFCYEYYRACLPGPEHRIRQAAAAKATLNAARVAARHAERAAKSARQLWDTFDPTLWDFLRTLAELLPRTSPRRVLVSDPGFAVLLERYQQLVQTISLMGHTDRGGRQRDGAFVLLGDTFGRMYMVVTGLVPTRSTKDGFFLLMSAIIALLQAAEKDLPGIHLNLPAGQVALRMRLQRTFGSNRTVTEK